MVKFSVIIPAYNAEKYIESCITSVLNQEYNELEIIVVNDGSSDSTGKIIEDLAIKNKQIKIISKINEGVSVARNKALEIATGEYVLFLDSDDRMAKETLIKISDIVRAKGYPDIIFANYIREYVSENRLSNGYYEYDEIKVDNSCSESILGYLFGEVSNFSWCIWAHIYKLEVIQQNRVFFEQSLSVNEDGNWLIEVILKSKNFAATNLPICYYKVDNIQSVTNTKYSIKKIEDNLYVLEKWFNYFKKIKFEEKSRDIMLDRISREYLDLTIFINQLEADKRKQIINRMKDNKEIYSYCKGIKYKIIKLLILGIGFKNTVYIVGKLYLMNKRLK